MHQITRSRRVIAVVGNPNTGKSTLFNALSGLRQQVGNYAGVTVEKRVGHLSHAETELCLIDLPGTYSLTPRSPDELVAVDVLLGDRRETEAVDLVLCVVDACNLERHLYLVSQLMELGLPLIVAVNMLDIAEAEGLRLDLGRLEHNLGVPTLPIHAKRGVGLDQLKAALAAGALVPPQGNTPLSCLAPPVRAQVSQVASLAGQAGCELPGFVWERLLLDDRGPWQAAWSRRLPSSVSAAVEEARRHVRELGGVSAGEEEARARYRWIDRVLEGVVQSREGVRWLNPDRIDQMLMHPWWGLLAMALTMLVLFQAVFSIAQPASDLIDMLTGSLAGLVRRVLDDGPLQSLLTDGVIEGVGGVLVFLPQIFLLFFLIALLEDSGYLARIACLMDGILSRVGLSGKSFIPLLSSFACAIPGIMAARTIENRRDRLATILIAPFMSCSARLPVYALLIAAFVPQRGLAGGLLGLQGLTMLAMYLVGIVVAVLTALLLKGTVLREETPDFVMELPPYKWPAVGVVARRVWDGGWSFVEGAGTLIVAVTILVWAAAYFPRDAGRLPTDLVERRQQLEAQLAELPGDQRLPTEQAQARRQLEGEIQGHYLKSSYLGRAGRWIEPLVWPLGWDWRIGCAVIASFPAREVVVATLGVLYNLGDDSDEASPGLRQKLREATWDGTDVPVFSLPVALSLMVFFALCAQCASTLAVIRRETGSWRWPAASFCYMTSVAYLAAGATYQLFSRLPW